MLGGEVEDDAMVSLAQKCFAVAFEASQREIADEAIRRGLVSNISQRSVGRFLKKPLQANEWVILDHF